MSDVSSSALPLNDDAHDAGSSGGEELQWEVVAETPGLLAARIIADRLQTEGIPARAWQESVGQAFGMVYGPLGTGFVSVPEAFVAQAQELLEAAENQVVDFDGEEE
jgi:hypothetical protein